MLLCCNGGASNPRRKGQLHRFEPVQSTGLTTPALAARHARSCPCWEPFLPRPASVPSVDQLPLLGHTSATQRSQETPSRDNSKELVRPQAYCELWTLQSQVFAAELCMGSGWLADLRFLWQRTTTGVNLAQGSCSFC
eukprot:2685721-Pleurochrysis_carterae.AAC.2